MTNLQKRISVRISNNDYNKITKLSNQLGKSKALIFRAIIHGYNHENKGLSTEQLTKFYKVMNGFNKLYRIAYRDGNNLNQIARAENKNGFSSYSPNLISQSDYDFRVMYSLLRKVVTYGSLRDWSQS